LTLRQRRLCYDLACVFPPTPSHRVRGWGKPVSLSPRMRARPSILSGAGGWGKPVSPFPSSRAYVHVRRSCAWRTTPRCTCPGSAGVPPASRLRGHGDRPFPAPPPLGAGTRLLPPAGGGWEGGCTRRTMVTAALHAAPPHNAAMNIRLFLGGLCPPKPSRGGGGMGKPGFPMPLRAGVWGNPVSPHPSPRAYVHVRRGAPREPPGGRSRGRRRRGGETPPLRRPASRQGLRPPDPPTGWGHGETRFPHAPAGGGVGKPGSPIVTEAQATKS